MDERDTIVLVQPRTDRPYIILQENKNEFSLYRFDPVEAGEGDDEDEEGSSEKHFDAVLVSQGSFFATKFEL